MTTSSYLIALGLIEQNGQRAMPLGGKSLTNPSKKKSTPLENGEGIAFELLLRIMQRSEEKPLRRVAGNKSLLLLEIPMDVMQDQLPSIKAEWIEQGDSPKLISKLKDLSIGIWAIDFIKYEGIILQPL